MLYENVFPFPFIFAARAWPLAARCADLLSVTAAGFRPGKSHAPGRARRNDEDPGSGGAADTGVNSYTAVSFL